MNLDLMIQSLKAEKEAIDSAILVLERLAYRNKARRGRPPAWLQVRHAAEGDFLPPAKAGRKPARKGFSEETKRKMAEAQRRRWAAKRKEEGN